MRSKDDVGILIVEEPRRQSFNIGAGDSVHREFLACCRTTQLLKSSQQVLDGSIQPIWTVAGIEFGTHKEPRR